MSDMITIREEDLIETVADALQYISYYHPMDYIQALGEAYKAEQGPAAKDATAAGVPRDVRAAQRGARKPGEGGKEATILGTSVHDAVCSAPGLRLEDEARESLALRVARAAAAIAVPGGHRDMLVRADGRPRSRQPSNRRPRRRRRLRAGARRLGNES